MMAWHHRGSVDAGRFSTAWLTNFLGVEKAIDCGLPNTESKEKK